MDENKYQKHVENPVQFLDSIQSIQDPRLTLIGSLIDELDINKVGDFRIIIHPNIPMKASGKGVAQMELDLVIVNKFGVFCIDVINWHGKIIAYDTSWIVESKDQEIKHNNPLDMVVLKCKLLQSYLNRPLNVIPLIILYQGIDKFINRSHVDLAHIVDIKGLVPFISNPRKLLKFQDQEISDNEVSEISSVILNPRRSLNLAADSTTDAPPPDVKKKKKKGKS